MTKELQALESVTDHEMYVVCMYVWIYLYFVLASLRCWPVQPASPTRHTSEASTQAYMHSTSITTIPVDHYHHYNTCGSLPYYWIYIYIYVYIYNTILYIQYIYCTSYNLFILLFCLAALTTSFQLSGTRYYTILITRSSATAPNCYI